jgi:hypothetical protein
MWRTLVALLVGFGAAAAPAASQQVRVSVCDQLADVLRQPELRSGGANDVLLLTISTGDRPPLPIGWTPLLTPTADSGPDPATWFRATFRARFNPSAALARAVDGFLEYTDAPRVLGLPDSQLRMVQTIGGSMGCEDFVLFRTRDGRSDLVSTPRDVPTTNGCYTGRFLSKVGGTDVFIDYQGDGIRNRYAFHLTPWRDSTWGSSCRVEARYSTAYLAREVFVPRDGPLNEDTISSLAPRIVEAYAASAERLRYGPPVPDREARRADRMRALHDAGPSTVPVPTFESLAAPKGQRYETLVVADAAPVVMDGVVYLARLGRANVGWRQMTDSVVIFYTLQDDALKPIASAIVAQRVGPLESLQIF